MGVRFGNRIVSGRSITVSLSLVSVVFLLFTVMFTSASVSEATTNDPEASKSEPVVLPDWAKEAPELSTPETGDPDPAPNFGPLPNVDFEQNPDRDPSPTSASERDPASEENSIQTEPVNQKKIVHLTLDDGPVEESKLFLDVLSEYDIPVTWFVVGQHVEANPELTRQIVAEGHALANHTYTHPQLPKVDARSQLTKTQQVIAATTGLTPTCYRPPFGATNETIRRTASELGLAEWLWDIDPLDWQGHRTQEQVVASLDTVSATEPRHGSSGVVVLLHDGGDDGVRTAASLREWLERNHGEYDFRILDGCEPKPVERPSPNP